VTLHPQATRLLAAIASLGNPPVYEMEPVAARAMRASMRRPSTEPIHETRDLDADGVAARLYRPTAELGLGLVVYFHGGGWVLGDIEGHDNLCRVLANESRAAVLSVDYRLAPEHPYPAGLTDALNVTRWAAANANELGCSAQRMAVGGDSAGANLATVVAQLQVVPLKFQLLLYPVIDARMGTDSYTEFADGPFLTAAGMKWFIELYLSGGQGSADDPRVSPILASDAALSGSPPTAIVTAGHDPLRDEGEQYAERLIALGVPTSLVRYSGMIHSFSSQLDFLDDARASLAHGGALIRSALKVPDQTSFS
jgi:acetyl esterase